MKMRLKHDEALEKRKAAMEQAFQVEGAASRRPGPLVRVAGAT